MQILTHPSLPEVGDNWVRKTYTIGLSNMFWVFTCIMQCCGEPKLVPLKVCVNALSHAHTQMDTMGGIQLSFTQIDPLKLMNMAKLGPLISKDLQVKLS